jgi:hypothetical protein
MKPSGRKGEGEGNEEQEKEERGKDECIIWRFLWCGTKFRCGKRENIPTNNDKAKNGSVCVYLT